MLRTTGFLAATAAALLACEAAPPPGAGPEGGLEAVDVTDPAQYQRMIADTLYEGLQALDADRLLTPPGDNAHERFLRVLSFEPDNDIALQGVRDIVGRYLELSAEAARQGRFEQAGVFLERARAVDRENHPGIARGEALLRAERDSDDLFYELDGRAVAARSERARGRLADIARRARAHDALFLITAPSDEAARWIYSVMSEAVPGYRLRGNIELAARSSVRLRMPAD